MTNHARPQREAQKPSAFLSGAARASNPVRFYEFDRFRIDTKRRLLTRDGEPIALKAKALETLVLLVQHAGRLLEKEELMNLLWPDTAVEEANLTQNVFEVRKALGEVPGEQRFIATVARRGYRFVADVRAIGDEASAHDDLAAGDRDSKAPLIGPAVGHKRSRWALSARSVMATAVVLGLAIAGLLWLGADRFSGRPASAGSSIRSLAVLPLENFSRDPDQEHVADGMTEALIARLGSVRSLRVISRTSAMQFKGTGKPVSEIAKALAVDAVVTGSVQRSGGRIRITAHVIRCDPEEQLWSGTYDRDIHDVLALQSEVALIVAKQVGIVVTGADSSRVTGVAPVVSPEVYDRYLKGRLQFNKYSQASIEESITHFKSAIAADASFAPAYVGLAAAYSSLGTITIGASAPSDVLREAVGAATRALELDPTLADAYVWLSIAQQQQWRWVEAEAALKRALELNPSHAHAHEQLGWWLLFHRQTDEAIASSRRGRDLDPLAMHVHLGFAVTLYNARRYDEALRELQSILTIDPDHVGALMIRGLALVEAGRFDEAIESLERGAIRSDRNPMMLGALAAAQARGGHGAQAQRVIDELIELRKTRYVTPAAFVFAYMGLREHDRAFEWLERAYGERNAIMKFIGVNPIYDPVRTDPRFVDLLRRVGLH